MLPQEVTHETRNAPMKLFTDDGLKVALSYPENFAAPARVRLGGLVLQFDTGDATIYKNGRSAGQSLSGILDDFTNPDKNGLGRIVVSAKGFRKLDGHDAAFAQTHFNSAAGRSDMVIYFVLTDSAEYRVACGTKQGPPIIDWAQVLPICERVLDTIHIGN